MAPQWGIKAKSCSAEVRACMCSPALAQGVTIQAAGGQPSRGRHCLSAVRVQVGGVWPCDPEFKA